MCIWCRGERQSTSLTKPPMLCSSTCKALKRQFMCRGGGMNKFPNEEIARKSKREEIPSAHTLPAYQEHFGMRNGEQAVEGMGKKTQQDLCCLITPCAKFDWHLQMLRGCSLLKGATALWTPPAPGTSPCTAGLLRNNHNHRPQSLKGETLYQSV